MEKAQKTQTTRTTENIEMAKEIKGLHIAPNGALFFAYAADDGHFIFGEAKDFHIKKLASKEEAEECKADIVRFWDKVDILNSLEKDIKKK
jgi:hypothetical protein